MFVDTATVMITAGNGGNGCVSFRHEKFIDRGGPDGGDGGNGGNVIFVASQNVNTLVSFRYKQQLKAEDGEAGFKQKMHGGGGKDLTVKVPVGTLVLSEGKPVADLTEDGQQAVVAKGGQGGFGNAHFISSVRQAPQVAELGEKGEAFEFKLELKLLADVGLVGLPNAGKSTFLSVVTNATPEIGDYAFTTLTPNLGVADIDDTSLLIADIPGLIEGASEGKGLGDAFLRHVERTAVLLHLIDAYSNDVAADYKTIVGELAAYSPELAERPQVVALTKIDGLDEDIITMQQEALQVVVAPETLMFAISSSAHTNLKPLLRELRVQVETARKVVEQDIEENGRPVIELGQDAKDEAWHVLVEDKRFTITGHKIEKFAARTNFDSAAGLQRFRDILKKMGIMHHLNRNGLKHGDTIAIGKHGEFHFVYE
ncbi:MAG TPA: GTPase ObgE [Candidatus Saccharimonadales bacterium]|jgi:GTP-binding protein|nr:GTPase ObgE [Candidatus Saccharimonadales bacterium]